MAIAYFIPDQAKLLAGQRSNNSRNRPTSRINTGATRSTIANNRTTEANPLHASNTNTNNRAYGTTINITVPNLNATPEEPLGCWDFLTQVFCYALRFYHESSQLQPTVIQISVNFNAQTNTTTTTTATSGTTTMATVNESNTTLDSASNSSRANSTSNNLATAAVINSPRKCSKRKN